MSRANLASSFPNGRKRGAAASKRLVSAYNAVFTGKGSAEDADMVLADMANFTGFYRVNGIGVSGEDRAFADGLRAAYGRIFRFLNLTDAERRSLEFAAREEALADSEEGDL